MSKIKIAAILAGLVLVASVSVAGQKLKVTVLESRQRLTLYEWSQPGMSSTIGGQEAECRTYAGRVSCTSSYNGTTITVDPSSGTVRVVEAEVYLKLPDARIVAAHCGGKKVGGWGWHPDRGQMRNCLIPENGAVIEADFDGDRVKLSWTVLVGISDSKKLKETYTHVTVLTNYRNEK